MEDDFKKTQTLTFWMMAGVMVMGIVALVISDRHGYGASSEAKINFLRLVVIIVSLTQIVMAGALKKIVSAMSVKPPQKKKIFAQQMIANLLCEAPALFGLGLVCISKTFTDYAIMGGISLIAFTVFFPRDTSKGS